MPPEIGEGGSFFLRAGPMDARQPLRVELLADSRGLGMAYLECQRDRFGNDVIGRQEVVNQPEIPERLKNLNDARMMRVPL